MNIKDVGMSDSLAEFSRIQSSALDTIRKQIAPFDRIAEITRLHNNQLSTALATAQESLFHAARRIADQYAYVLSSVEVPLYSKVENPYSDVLAKSAEAAERFRQSMMGPTACMEQQIAEIHNFEVPHLPKSTPVDNFPHIGPRVTASAEVLGRINDELEQHMGNVAGTNRRVFIEITPPDGRAIVAITLTAKGDNLIVISGYEAESLSHSQSSELRTVTVGASSFQYEFITVHMPPPKPDLRIVK